MLKRIAIVTALLLTVVLAVPARAAETAADAASPPIGPFTPADWPWWRGQHRDGSVTDGAKPPTKWSATDNVIWKTPLPGRGHGSAIVVGDQVFIAIADHEAQRQAIVCLDKAGGKVQWTAPAHEGGLIVEGNKKASYASSTPACDGQRIYINFLNDHAIYTTAFSRDGKKLWQTKISDYVVHQGYGSSPCVYGPLVIVSADNKGGGAIAGLDRIKGNIVWRHDRPSVPNYASPVVLNVAGKEQLIFIGCDLVSSYAPLSGDKLWEFKGATTECVTTTVTDGKHVYTSGGYPRNHVAAVRADGSGETSWQNGTRVYVPSMLMRDGYLYASGDAGSAYCWKADTGEQMWSGRLGGTFYASPVLVGGLIYATNETGKTYIFKAQPGDFELIAENQLGNEAMATMTVSAGRIYTRVAEHVDGRRQEFLYCIGDGK